MDNKEKYEKALKRAREVLDSGSFNRGSIEYIFPEIEKPKGERIRKNLISTFKDDYGENSSARFAGIKVKDIISWLEKQKEKHISSTPIWKHWKDGIAGNGNGTPIYLVKTGITYSITSCLGFECDYIELSELDKLLSKKQGEQKPVESSRDYNDIDPHFGIPVEDLMLKEKPTDKVEPKFKIEKDNWYVCIRDLDDDYGTRAFRKGDIYYSTKDETLMPDNSNVPYEIKYCVEHYFHLWTIKDANDGDVLACGNFIIIYKLGSDREDIICSYCSLNNDEKFTNETEDWFPDKFYPATKEQRDLLFQKMKEVGYEWDTEKKELKKIEQKPDKCDGCNNVKGCVTCVDGDQWAHYKEVEQKPAWSEEDDKQLDIAMESCRFLNKIETTDWLKSLKQRLGGK